MSREAENLYKMVISNIFVLSYAPTYSNQLSTDVRRSPFLSRKELRIASFPCVSFSVLNFHKRIFLFTPAICKDCTVSRIRQDSCRHVKPCRASHRLENGIAILADSEPVVRGFSAYPVPSILKPILFTPAILQTIKSDREISCRFLMSGGKPFQCTI